VNVTRIVRVSTTLLVVVGLTAVPTHLYVLAGSNRMANVFFWLMIGGLGTAVLLGAIVTILLLRMGFRAFRQLEF